MFLLSIRLTAALWKGRGTILKAYLLATLILLAVMVPITSRATSASIATHIRDLTQRLYTLTVFPVVAVSALVLALRYRRQRLA
jgi:uncharacterized BrkB/YihY/UPF0761 family membrane protein